MADNPATSWWVKDADPGAMIQGRTDREVDNSVSQGVDKVLGDIFNGSSIPVRPATRAPSSNSRSSRLTAAIRTSSMSRMEMQRCERLQGSRLYHFRARTPGFLLLAGGKLDETQALMNGKLRVSGDMLFTQTMQPRFKRQQIKML